MNKTSEMILNFKRILNNVFHLKMYQIKNKILEIIIKKHFHWNSNQISNHNKIFTAYLSQNQLEVS